MREGQKVIGIRFTECISKLILELEQCVTKWTICNFACWR